MEGQAAYLVGEVRRTARELWGCLMKGRWAIALFATILLASLPTKASKTDLTTVSLHATDSIAIAAADPAPMSCNMVLVISFSGFQDTTGVVFGTWTHHASTICKLPFHFKMDYLFVQDKLFEFGALRQASIPDSCGACLAVASSASLYCDPCNGPWYGTSQHQMRFPTVIGAIVPTKPGTCKTINLRTIECNLRTTTITL